MYIQRSHRRTGWWRGRCLERPSQGGEESAKRVRHGQRRPASREKSINTYNGGNGGHCLLSELLVRVVAGVQRKTAELQDEGAGLGDIVLRAYGESIF